MLQTVSYYHMGDCMIMMMMYFGNNFGTGFLTYRKYTKRDPVKTITATTQCVTNEITRVQKI